MFRGFQIRFKYSSSAMPVVSFLCTGSGKLHTLLASQSHREIWQAGYNTSTHFFRILPVDGPVTVLTCTACSRRSSKIPVVGYVWRDCVTPKSAAELSSSMSKRNVSLMPAFDETEGHYRKGLTANYRGLSRPKRPRIGQGTK